jgi:hypothetical protein
MNIMKLKYEFIDNHIFPLFLSCPKVNTRLQIFSVMSLELFQFNWKVTFPYTKFVIGYNENIFSYGGEI